MTLSRVAVLAALLQSGCRTRPFVETIDLAVPPDLAEPTCNGQMCGADEFCFHPCTDLVYCYPSIDGGCFQGDSVQTCAADLAVGCTFDFTPRCMKGSATCIATRDCHACTGCQSCFELAPLNFACPCP
jgi:hypothetical protein